MAITSGGVGAVAASSTATVSPPYPDGIESGDGLLLVRSAKPETTVFDTPDGWTFLGDRAGGAGAFGNDTGPMKVAAYWREATGAETGTLDCASEAGTFDVGQAFIARWTKDPAATWDVDLSGGVDPDQGNDWTVVADPALPLTAGDVVEVALAWPTDSARFWSDETLTAVGATVVDLAVPLAAGGTGLGADMATRAHAYSVASGSSMTGPTYVGMVNSATNVTGATVMVRLREVSSGGAAELAPASVLLSAAAPIATPGPVLVGATPAVLAFAATGVGPQPGPVGLVLTSAGFALVGGLVLVGAETVAARGSVRVPARSTVRTPTRSGVRIR